MKAHANSPKRESIIKANLSKKILERSFLNAINDVESLSTFYETFRDSWQARKLQFEQDHIIGLKLNDCILKLLASENFPEAYEQEKSTIIEELKLDDIIELNFTTIDERKSISYSMKGKYGKSPTFDPKFSRDEHSKFDSQYEIFTSSILSNIIIIFERYFSRIFEYMIILNPENYFEGKSVKLSELFYYEPTELLSQEIKKHVEENMYDSLKTLSLLKTKSAFDIDRHVKIRKDFEEIYYRRNIFVHNSGIANGAYLSNVDNTYCKNVKCGDKLICDDTYNKNAISTLKKLICLLYYELLTVNNFETESYEILQDRVAFPALCNQDYAFAETLYFILGKHQNINFADKTMYHINHMLSLKHQGKPIEKMLKNFDVSAMQDKFVLAKECLLEHHDKVYEILSCLYPKEMPAEAIRDWPLFICFRESEEYQRFKTEHSNDFKQHIFEDSQEVETSETEALS